MHRAPFSAVVELLQKNSNARVLHDALLTSERRHDGRRRRRHGLTCPVAARDAGPFGLHTGATRTRPHTDARKHLLPPTHQSPITNHKILTDTHNDTTTLTQIAGTWSKETRLHWAGPASRAASGVAKGGAAVLIRVFAAHFSLAKSGELWPLAQASARSASQCAGPGQGVPQALARARNRTCMELSSALDGRTRFEPGSGSFSSSIGCVKSCRGATVRSTACAEFITCSKEQDPPSTTPALSSNVVRNPPLAALDAPKEGQK
eukprot:scaffold24311_cov114-Isochrysis_galbana.AAC.1